LFRVPQRLRRAVRVPLAAPVAAAAVASTPAVPPPPPPKKKSLKDKLCPCLANKVDKANEPKPATKSKVAALDVANAERLPDGSVRYYAWAPLWLLLNNQRTRFKASPHLH